MTGQAEVVRVTPKMSYLKLRSGSAKGGDICRLVQGSNIGSAKIGTDAGGRKDNAIKRTSGRRSGFAVLTSVLLAMEYNFMILAAFWSPTPKFSNLFSVIVLSFARRLSDRL